MCGKSPLTRLQHVCLSRVKSGVKAGDLQGTVAQSSSAVCAQLDIDIHWCASSSLGKSLDSSPGSSLSIHTTSFLLVSSACSPASPAQCHWLACLFYAQLPLTASSTQHYQLPYSRRTVLGLGLPLVDTHFIFTQQHKHMLAIHSAHTPQIYTHMYAYTCTHTAFTPISTPIQQHTAHKHTCSHCKESASLHPSPHFKYPWKAPGKLQFLPLKVHSTICPVPSAWCLQPLLHIH